VRRSREEDFTDASAADKPLPASEDEEGDEMNEV
jgi:hypothetical protein